MIHFIRIPKTASRSIKSTNYFVCSEHIPVSHLETKFADSWIDDIKFCIVRNPYDRLVSAYSNGRAFWEEKKFPHFREFKRYPTFEDFCQDDANPFFFSEVHRTPRKNQRTASLVVHPHFLPQVYWLKNSKGKLDIHYIIRFENLSSDWEAFLKQYNLPYKPLPHKNKSNHKPWRQYYTSSIAEKVYQIYQEDFQRLDYSRDSFKDKEI